MTCIETGCAKATHCRGYCATHYGRRRAAGEFSADRRAGGRSRAPRVTVECANRCGGVRVLYEREAQRLRRGVICDACLDERSRSLDDRPCRDCGQRFRARQKRDARCDECRRRYKAAMRPQRTVESTCETCGEQFVARRRASASVRFCGNPCRLDWFSRAFVGEGSPHYRHGDAGLYRMGWKQARRACYARDGYRCAECGESVERKMVAAHLVPREAIPEALRKSVADGLDNLVTLCMSHHSSFDRNPATRWDYETADRPSWPAWANPDPDVHGLARAAPRSGR